MKYRTTFRTGRLVGYGNYDTFVEAMGSGIATVEYCITNYVNEHYADSDAESKFTECMGENEIFVEEWDGEKYVECWRPSENSIKAMYVADLRIIKAQKG